MTKQELVRRLDAADTSQAQMCRDLGIAPTTAMRWKTIPGYAESYIIALGCSDALWRMEFRHRLAMVRKTAALAEAQ